MRPDALGSVRQWTDAAGTVVGSQAYTPFGIPTDRQGVLPAPFGFAGEWTDAATGLQYLRARWYDPATGRFTQVDPFPGLLSLPTTQHPYAYALNNPLRYTDPSGRIPPQLALSLIAAGVAGILDFAYQVSNNMQRGMNFWQATCYRNINWSHILQTSLTVGFTTFSFLITAPTLLFMGGQALSGVGMLLGWSGLFTAGLKVAVVGELLFYYLWTNRPLEITSGGRMTWTVDRALRQLSKRTGESFTLCGGYGETEQGIYGRMAAEGITERGQPVPAIPVPAWRNTGAPKGRDVDLWQPVSPEVERGIRDIFGFYGELDYYNAHHHWKGVMPPASRTYYPDGSVWQIPSYWGLPSPRWPMRE